MTITYSLLTQTISLVISPAEMQEIKGDIRENITETFRNLKDKLKEKLT